MGAPYVATEKGEILDVLKSVDLQKGMYFYDLGCGDGRIVRQAVKKYGVHGIGIDINPLLITLARLRSWGMSKEQILFHRQNFLQTDLTQADVVYMYLLPSIIKKLENKFTHELKPGAKVISYAFKIPYMESLLVQRHKGPIFSAYIYQM